MTEDVFSRGGEFETISAAPTTEEIHQAMKLGKWRGTEPVKGALQVLFEMQHVEQFNFGPLSLDTIREAQTEAVEFIEYGALTLPYEECVFRCSVQFDNRTVGFHIFSVLKKWDDGRQRIASLGSIHSEQHMLTFRSDNMMRVEEIKGKGRGIVSSIPKMEIAYWEPMIGTIGDGTFLTGNGEIIGEASLLMMGMVMILNTKGVLKERTAPPAKPNKVRAARGVPLLPYTTRVYTSVYNAAVRAGPAGTHSSPRPHRRRAHIRHYPKTEKHEAYTLPIAAMLVNWDGKPLPDRAEYVVK